MPFLEVRMRCSSSATSANMFGFVVRISFFLKLSQWLKSSLLAT